MKIYKLSAFFIIFALSSPVVSQGVLDHLKIVYGYNNWPQGSVSLLQEPPLDSLFIQDLLFIGKDESVDGTNYRWVAPDMSTISVTVKAHDTLNQARMALLVSLSQFTTRLSKSDDFNLKVGDIAFIDNNGGGIRAIYCIKNNLMFTIKSTSSEINNQQLFDAAIAIESSLMIIAN